MLPAARSSAPASGTEGRRRAKYEYNCCSFCKRDHAQLRGFLGVQNDRTRTLRPDARARATTGLDTPSSGRASVPSRIRPESTVREITKPVSLALSSSTPSDARDRARSGLGFGNARGVADENGRSPTARASRNTRNGVRNGVHEFYLSTRCDARTCWRARSAACDERARFDSPPAVLDWYAQELRVRAVDRYHVAREFARSVPRRARFFAFRFSSPLTSPQRLRLSPCRRIVLRRTRRDGQRKDGQRKDGQRRAGGV